MSRLTPIRGLIARGRQWRTSRPLPRATDVGAVFVLLALTGLVAWNRFAFDVWLTRYDIYTQFLPWYHYLGERIAAFDVPGWNPHYLSGTPFAGHPLSGWMYLPAMLAFALFPVLTGFKAMVLAHLVLAALSTYAFARVLGMRALGSLVAAIVFAFGPFLEWNTYTSLQFAQFAAWVPLTLLGIELAFRRDRWWERVIPLCVAAFAFCQMMAGWIGEGWIYSGLLTGGYIGYRALLSPSGFGRNFAQRLKLATATGAVVLGGGTALCAAGILPRLAVNAQTNLAGGDYADLGPGGILNAPWDAQYLVTQVMGMGSGYHHRAAGLGGAVVVLMILAPILARGRFAVPFFTGLTVAALILTLDTTPLHHALYLIPRYRELHEHDPWRVVALGSVGPAMLCGAAVDALGRLQGRVKLLPVVLAPLALVTAFVLTQDPSDGVALWGPVIAATVVTVVAALVVGLPRNPDSPRSLRWVTRTALALVAVVVFVQPTGLELIGSWFGWPADARWERRLNLDSEREAALTTEVSTDDPGGAGAYLREQLEASGPFRYLGYGGVGHPSGGPTSRSYMDRRFDPYVQAILVNGRPMFLDLYEIQGYDPIQLARYVDFMRAINGKGQDYHTAFVSDEGVDSPLLDLLDMRYVLIDASLPLDRPDVVSLTAGKEEVFRNEYAIVYESTSSLSHAWIVHDVRQVERGDALPLLVDGTVDPYQTALVEGSVPDVEPVSDPANDRAVVTRYDAEAITIDTQTDAPGFLVVSEVYAEGWQAYVDGEAVTVMPTHHALRGVPIPSGDATVEMRYEPVSLQIGLWISGGTALLMAVVLVAALWRTSRS